MDQDVRRIALLDQVPVIASLIFHSRIRSLNEDVRFEASAAEDALDAEHFMPDRIAVPERGEHLVDLRLSQFSTGPDGSSARMSLAGRSSLRHFANQPGSGSGARTSAPRASSSFNCARMSRYFCSITGHA